jgi:hypothetical protein
METITAEVDSPQTESEFSIENASTDDLRDALGITPATEEVQPSTEAPQPEDNIPEPEAEVESAEPQAESLESEDADEKLGKRRIRPRNELDQQVIDLYRSEGFQGSFADASRIIYGQGAAQPAQQQLTTPNQEQVEATEPDPISGIDKQSDDIRAAILELEGQVGKAAEELETTEALRLQREIMKQELQLQTITLRKEQLVQEREQAAYQTHRAKAMDSRDRVYNRYPDLQDKNSVLRKQFDDYVSQAQSDPDYAAVFDSPRWPEFLANEFVSVMPAPAVAQQPQAVAPQPQAPQMGTQAKVLTTGTTAQPVNAPITADGLLQQLPSMNKDDIYALLGSPGGAQPNR